MGQAKKKQKKQNNSSPSDGGRYCESQIFASHIKGDKGYSQKSVASFLSTETSESNLESQPCMRRRPAQVDDCTYLKPQH